jgi:squalene-associated FAD-dependent desaturase
MPHQSALRAAEQPSHKNMASGSRVIVVGGGLAGLAAASALGARGIPVTLLESRGRWGGRASSFVDQQTGECIDNCQHVAMGCCTNFFHFCRTVGIAELFRREEGLTFVGPDGESSPLAASRLPAPLHLFPALVRLKYFSWRDKLAIARGLFRLAWARPRPEDASSFREWLVRHGQPQAAIDRFWHVVLVSALSERLDRISVLHARKVFVDGFLANRMGWEVWLPTAALDELYGPRIVSWLETHEVSARLNSGVKCLRLSPARRGELQPGTADTEGMAALGVELRSGEFVSGDQIILALPQHLVLDLFPETLRAHPSLAKIARLETAPIASVHLWFDRPIMDAAHLTLVDRLSQWVFNRSAIGSAAGASNRGHYYQVVISASHELAGRPGAETINKVVDELAEILPAIKTARLQHARVVTEHKAVVSMTPGAESLRPTQQSPIRNVQLAGDWTRTGWPCTMEGAIRSGYLAAENVLKALGRGEQVLQSDLPTAVLSKLLLGL